MYELDPGLLLIRDAPQHPVARVLQRIATWSPVTVLADLSYPLYLGHQFCFALTAWLLWDWLQPGRARPVSVGVFIVASMTLSALGAAGMFYGVEKPTRDKAKYLIKRYLPPTPVPAGAATVS